MFVDTITYTRVNNIVISIHTMSQHGMSFSKILKLSKKDSDEFTVITCDNLCFRSTNISVFNGKIIILDPCLEKYIHALDTGKDIEVKRNTTLAHSLPWRHKWWLNVVWSG